MTIMDRKKWLTIALSRIAEAPDMYGAVSPDDNYTIEQAYLFGLYEAFSLSADTQTEMEALRKGYEEAKQVIKHRQRK